MKVGDEVAKKNRKELIDSDPKHEKWQKIENGVLVFFYLYIGGHILYYFLNR